VKPDRASLMAVAKPIPVDAPVTKATGWAWVQLLRRMNRKHERPAPPEYLEAPAVRAGRWLGLVRVHCLDLGLVLAPEGVESAGGIDPAVGVGAKEVTLALDHRGGETLAAQAVVVGQ
jgi:hypothetical protein